MGTHLADLKSTLAHTQQLASTERETSGKRLAKLQQQCQELKSTNQSHVAELAELRRMTVPMQELSSLRKQSAEAATIRNQNSVLASELKKALGTAESDQRRILRLQAEVQMHKEAAVASSESLKREVEESASLQRQLGDLRIDLESARRELNRMRKDNIRESKIELSAQLKSAKDRIQFLESQHENSFSAVKKSSKVGNDRIPYLVQQEQIAHGSPSSIRTVSPIQSRLSDTSRLSPVSASRGRVSEIDRLRRLLKKVENC